MHAIRITSAHWIDSDPRITTEARGKRTAYGEQFTNRVLISNSKRSVWSNSVRGIFEIRGRLPPRLWFADCLHRLQRSLTGLYHLTCSQNHHRKSPPPQAWSFCNLKIRRKIFWHDLQWRKLIVRHEHKSEIVDALRFCFVLACKRYQRLSIAPKQRVDLGTADCKWNI